jgi:chromosome segregation ATPase
MIKTIYSCPGVAQSQEELTDDDLVDTLKSIFNEKTVLSEKCDELSSHLNNSNQAKDDLLNYVNEFAARLISLEANLGGENRRASKLKELIDELSAMTLNDQLLSLKNSINEMYTNEHQQIEIIESQIALKFEVPIESEKNFVDLFAEIEQKLNSERAKINELEEAIEQLKTSTEEQKNQINEENKTNLETGLANLENELKQKHEEEMNSLISNHNDAIDALKNELDAANTLLSEVGIKIYNYLS